jgi:hypothetical protein
VRKTTGASCNKIDESVGLLKGAKIYTIYILADYACKDRA